MEEFYYDKHPNLIGPIMKTTVCKIVKKPKINNTISDKISSYFSDLYNDYIADNKIVVFIILGFVVFLIYKYYNKPEKKEEKEEFTNREHSLLKEIEDYQTKHLMYDNPPYMNPTESVELQDDDIIHYPPDPIPINLPDAGIVQTRNIYKNPPPYQSLNYTNYDHNNVYTNASRSYHNGSFNTYQNAQDTNIVNPNNWSNNFNTNTGNFVGPMTNMNGQVLNEYQAVSDNQTQNLLDAMKFGPMYASGDIEPPYAQDFF
jgi:large-conductance mechanosensitive channel